MPRYEWQGITRTGQTSSGVMAAASADAVAKVLRRQRIKATQVTPMQQTTFSIGRKKVKQLDVAVFTRQFSVMIDAGLPLVQCLDTLSKQAENKVFEGILDRVRREMEGGSTLADALKQHPKVFSDLYCNMVMAGEAGGILDIILRRLAAYIENTVKLKAAVRSASLYPAVIVSVAVLVVTVILWKVIPTFAALFAGLGAQLPLPTRIVVAASNFIGAYFPFVVAGMVIGAVAVRQYYRTDSGQRLIDAGLLKLPVVGLILRKIAVARFCRTLATLVSSGVPILNGLDITSKTAGNRVIADAVMDTRRNIEAGKSIAGPLGQSGVFPPMVIQMISVGEETGALDNMLTKVAEFYEEEVDTAVDNLVSLLEPVMIVFLGVIIGGIVVSMYLPMFDLINKI